MKSDEYDVLIVGGGPAGLSASVVLGRALRRVVLFDSGKPRNYASRAIHNFLSRDGIAPFELLALGRQEARRYGVKIVDAKVENIFPISSQQGECAAAFDITDAQGRHWLGRKLVLATGVVDILPEIPGFQHFYGRGIHHCPYCDAWEYRGKVIGAYGKGEKAIGTGRLLRRWSQNVLVFTDGIQPDTNQLELAAKLGLQLISEPVEAAGGDDMLEYLMLKDTGKVKCDALFFNTDEVQHSLLAAQAGCKLEETGEFSTDRKQLTNVKGLFVAGDADGDVQFAIVAVGEGAVVGVTANAELQKEDESQAMKSQGR